MIPVVFKLISLYLLYFEMHICTMFCSYTWWCKNTPVTQQKINFESNLTLWNCETSLNAKSNVSLWNWEIAFASALSVAASLFVQLESVVVHISMSAYDDTENNQVVLKKKFRERRALCPAKLDKSRTASVIL